MTKKPHRETANNTSVIVKEQLQLVKVEAELKKAIENINEYINTLCVSYYCKRRPCVYYN